MKNYSGINHEFAGWHMMAHVLRYYATRTGLMAYTSPEVTAMLSLKAPPQWPDVQIGTGPFSMRSSADIKADPERGALENEPGYTLNGYLLRPKTRGSVAIQSDNIAYPVLVDGNRWGDAEDRRTFIEMVRLFRRSAARLALEQFGAGR